MSKIVLVSDSHLRDGVLKKIVKAEADADYYLHCGDSELDELSVRPFVQVKGNNDYYGDFKDYLILRIDGHKIFMTHGHYYCVSMFSIDQLVAAGKEIGADIIFFGHTHTYMDIVIDGIHVINPGSCRSNRDGSDPSYCVVTLENGNIEVQRKSIPYSDKEKKAFWWL